MTCPKCKFKVRTVDSRGHKSGGTWRRKECLNVKCGLRFSTIELAIVSKEREEIDLEQVLERITDLERTVYKV